MRRVARAAWPIDTKSEDYAAAISRALTVVKIEEVGLLNLGPPPWLRNPTIREIAEYLRLSVNATLALSKGL